jgi:pimeloyl-ACP methyl ester carboxylesterase
MKSRGGVRHRFPTLLVVVWSLAGAVYADTTFTVQATVVDIDGAPLPSISVAAGELNDEDELKTPVTGATDDAGKVTLTVTTRSSSARVAAAVVDEPRGRVHEPAENQVRVKPGVTPVTFRLLPLPDAESAIGGGSVTTAGFFAGSGSGDQYPALETASVAVDPSKMQRWRARTALGRPPVLLVQGLPLSSTDVAPMEVYNQLFALVEALRQAGRDVWVLAFDDVQDPVAGNALAVSDAVAQASAAANDARVDVVGISLGGVMARYALAADEAKGGPSKGRVRLFASIDAPHQGANLQLGIQTGLWLAGGKTVRDILRSYAVQNLLYQWVGSDNWSKNGCGFPSNREVYPTAAAHDAFYAELNALNGDGYPHQCRNVALANASAAPRPQREGDVVYRARATAKVLVGTIELCSEDYKARPLDVTPGSLLPNDLLPTHVEMGNGLRFDLDVKFDPTFIPTASALDVRDGRSKFDATFTPAGAPSHHGELPPGALDFLLHELLL